MGEARARERVDWSVEMKRVNGVGNVCYGRSRWQESRGLLNVVSCWLATEAVDEALDER